MWTRLPAGAYGRRGTGNRVSSALWVPHVYGARDRGGETEAQRPPRAGAQRRGLQCAEDMKLKRVIMFETVEKAL